MKGLALSQKGMEDISSLEIQEILKTKPEVHEEVIIFDIKNLESLCLLCFKAQSITKCLLFLGVAKNENEIKKIIKKKEFKDFIKDSFSVRSNERELEAKLGELIKKEYKTTVNLTSPDTHIHAIKVQDKIYIGIDFSREDLGKREYRVFTGAEMLKSTTAYAMIRFSGFNRSETLLDPFCKSGIIPIEAALYDSEISINKFQKQDFFFWQINKINKDKIIGLFEKEGKKERPQKESKIFAIDPDMRRLASAKKNAKIAGVHKHISFSRQETQYLELKCPKESVDRIVTVPPQPSKHADLKKVKPAIQEFFYQAEYILKKNGTIVILAKDKEFFNNYAKKYNFKLEKIKIIKQGKESLPILKYSKNGQE